MTNQKNLLAVAISSTLVSGASAEMFAATAQDSALEEVVVSARKRVESPQEAPLSITALSGDSLAQQNVFNLQSLNLKMPNVSKVE